MSAFNVCGHDTDCGVDLVALWSLSVGHLSVYRPFQLDSLFFPQRKMCTVSFESFTRGIIKTQFL